MRHDERLGSMQYDNLVNSNGVTLITGMRSIKAGEGKLKRGTALALGADGKLVILGTADATANCVLCDDVDATTEVKAEVYLTGHFNLNALIVKDSYTITPADIEALRNGGIYLDNSME